MKLPLFIALLLFPLLCIGQQVESYELHKNNDLLVISNREDSIHFDLKKHRFSRNDNTMDTDYLYIAEYPIKLHGNKIYLDSNKYKFKRPVFSYDTYLVDQTHNEILMKFESDFDKNTLTVEKTENFEDLSNKKLKEVLETWALFKQAQYVDYHTENKTEYNSKSSSLVEGSSSPLLKVFD